MAEPGSPPVGTLLRDWLTRTHQALGSAAGSSITPDEQIALLDLARIAAHRSERIAAPLTTFLAGVALGGLPEGERAEALRSLAARLEA